MPLIIQIQLHADPRIFLPDGLASSGYATQTFAAQGFAVLIVPFADDALSSASEGPTIVARLDAAVDMLDAQGLIDRTRVGLVGFSRNGFQAHYAVTHPARTQWAAAAVLDSFTGSYSSSLGLGAVTGFAPPNGHYQAHSIASFWPHKDQWLEHEVTFNADRIRTPVLFTQHGISPSSEHYDASAQPVIGAYRANGKPIEYIWFPKASHALLRPRERMEEMGAVLDWMRFWLQDKQPLDPQRAQRWAPLREQQRKVLAQPVVKPVRWVPVPVAQAQ